MPDHKKPITRRVTEAFVSWCAENTPAAKFERTVAQGVVAAVIAGVTTGEWGAAFAVALIMAVLAPVQAKIGEPEDDRA